jgi:hypothetical protein
VFESLRPDHINQGVARFYLATPFYFLSFLPLQNGWLWVESSANTKVKAQEDSLAVSWSLEQKRATVKEPFPVPVSRWAW